MGNTRTFRFITLGTVLLLLALAAFVRPDLTKGHDDVLYLNAARAFLEKGFAHPYGREPLYPFFLAGLYAVGIDPAHWAPLVQSTLFFGALVFFLRARFRDWLSFEHAVFAGALVALVPTFLIPMNGSLYNEGVSATLVLLFLGAWTALLREALGALPRASVLLIWVLVTGVLGFLLGWTKGTFAFVHAVLALAIVLRWLSRVRVASVRVSAVVLFAALLTGASGFVAQSLWMRVQADHASAPAQAFRRYERAGVVLYGRTEYARHFDFEKQLTPFFVASLSISLYQRMYGDSGEQYTFNAENALGYQAIEKGANDEELFQRGLSTLREQPARQTAFGVLQLSRWTFHHGTSGFATLDLPGVGPVLQSMPVNLVLKLANLLLYLLPLCALLRLRWIAPPVTPAERMGVFVTAVYAFAYLAVFSFASVIVRMAWPIAPLLVVLNIWSVRVLWWRPAGAAPKI